MTNNFIVFGGDHIGALLEGQLNGDSVMLLDRRLTPRRHKFIERKEFNVRIFHSQNGRSYRLAILNDAIDVNDEAVREKIETIITIHNPDYVSE